MNTAQSPGAHQESESSIESVDLQQVQKEVKEAATDPIAFKVHHAEAQTMTMADEPRGQEIQTQTEPPQEIEATTDRPVRASIKSTEKTSTMQEVEEELEGEQDEEEEV